MGIVSILEVCVMNTLHSTMYDTYTILPTATASNNDEQQKQQHMEKEIQIKLKWKSEWCAARMVRTDSDIQRELVKQCGRYRRLHRRHCIIWHTSAIAYIKSGLCTVTHFLHVYTTTLYMLRHDTYLSRMTCACVRALAVHTYTYIDLLCEADPCRLATTHSPADQLTGRLT